MDSAKQNVLLFKKAVPLGSWRVWEFFVYIEKKQHWRAPWKLSGVIFFVSVAK